MILGSWRSCRLIALLLITTWVVAGCSLMRRTAAPTVTPTVQAGRSALNAVQPSVERSRGGGETTSLQAGDSLDIQPKDQIQVGDIGRAFLDFPQQLEVEMVRSGKIQIEDLQVDAAGIDSITLKQTLGHSYTRVESNAKLRLVLETDYATITPLADNTQFLVCHFPDVLTCVVTVNGSAQVKAGGQTVVLNAGESTYVLPNQPPRTPFCANLTEVRDWLFQMRGTQPTSDLGSLTVKWLQQPCGTPTGAPAATSATAVPTGATALVATSATTAVATAAQATAILATIVPATVASATAAPVRPSPTASATPTATLAPRPVTPTLAAAGPTPSSQGMVQIASGHFVVGSDAPDDTHSAAHMIDLASFWIDKYEVTNTQYKAFLDATGRTAPASWRAGNFPTGHDQHPAAGLTWNDAATYCAWTNKRLPSETEWEVAGRGPGTTSPLYPWGFDPTAGGKTGDLPERDTYPAGSMAFNVSPFGVYDMVGSVWQWVDAPYAPTPPGNKLLRGGRYGLIEDLAFRQAAQPDDQRFARVAGVRCATN
jgi:formylglycine-generating enzyme required for sulfatase activity